MKKTKEPRKGLWKPAPKSAGNDSLKKHNDKLRFKINDKKKR